MKKSIVISIGTAAIIIALVLGYVAFVKQESGEPVQAPEVNNNIADTIPTPENTTVPAPDDDNSEIDTADWLTYRNEEFGFEVKYPREWYLYSSNPSDIFIQPDKEEVDRIPGPHANAFEIKIKTVETNYDLVQEVKPRFDQAGISFTKEPINIGNIQGLKIASVCDGVGCGAPQWVVVKNNTLYYFDSNLGYNKTFDYILYTFKFIDKAFFCSNSIVKDIDGNIYETVQIGSQRWLKENLKVTKNSTGEAIIRYCYDNDPAICDTDGGLYDWNTAMNNSIEEGAQGICPNGWHVPKDSDWYILESGLSTGSCDANRNGWDCDLAGTKLKQNGSSGFEGILAGYRAVYPGDNGFYDRGKGAYFWSSTEDMLTKNGHFAIDRYLDLQSKVVRSGGDLYYPNSFSVRCIKD